MGGWVGGEKLGLKLNSAQLGLKLGLRLAKKWKAELWHIQIFKPPFHQKKTLPKNFFSIKIFFDSSPKIEHCLNNYDDINNEDNNQLKDMKQCKVYNFLPEKINRHSKTDLKLKLLSAV